MSSFSYQICTWQTPSKAVKSLEQKPGTMTRQNTCTKHNYLTGPYFLDHALYFLLKLSIEWNGADYGWFFVFLQKICLLCALQWVVLFYLPFWLWGEAISLCVRVHLYIISVVIVLFSQKFCCQEIFIVSIGFIETRILSVCKNELVGHWKDQFVLFKEGKYLGLTKTQTFYNWID